MSAPEYGYSQRARVLRAGPEPNTWLVQLGNLAADYAFGPVQSAVPDLAPGDRVLVTQVGMTHGDLVIVGRLPPNQPVALPIAISDVTGLQTALDGKTSDAEHAALVGTVATQYAELDGRLDTEEAVNDDQETRLDTAESTIVTHGTRLTTAEGTITTHGTRLTTAEGNITTLQGDVTTLQAKRPLRIARPNANAPFWSGSQATATSTTYVIAQVNIPDPGWAYFIQGFGCFYASSVTGGPYSHEITLRVGNSAHPSSPGTDIIGNNFMQTIDGGFATFRTEGVSQQSWTGAQTVYMILRNGATGTMTVGTLNTQRAYRFDLVVFPA